MWGSNQGRGQVLRTRHNWEKAMPDARRALHRADVTGRASGGCREQQKASRRPSESEYQHGRRGLNGELIDFRECPTHAHARDQVKEQYGKANKVQ